jgi:AcrR family transcriptional regulator
VATSSKKRSTPKKQKPPPRPYHHGDLRRAVLSEAITLIEERGHTDFTLREIARRIGVSHAAPYRHFADIRALMTELSTVAAMELTGRIEEALATAEDDLRARFLAAGFAYVRYALEHPASFLAMYSDAVDKDDPRVREATGRNLGILLRFVEEAQRAQAFPPGDPMALARPIWAMHHGLATLAAAGAFAAEGPGALRAIVDDAHARLLDGLLQPTPGRRPRPPPRAAS